MAAIYGEPLTGDKDKLREYYELWDQMGELMRKIEPEFIFDNPEAQELAAKIKQHGEIISQIFLHAVIRYDREAVIRLADSIWFFRNKRSAYDKPADKDRSKLLWLKLRLKSQPEKIMTIRELAKFLGYPKTSEDGYSSIRRKCKQLGVPIKSSRQIRKK